MLPGKTEQQVQGRTSMREARSAISFVHWRHAMPLVAAAAALLLSLVTSTTRAQELGANKTVEVKTGNATTPVAAPAAAPAPLAAGGFAVPDLTKRESFSGAMQVIVLLTILSLAPAILLMMTSFTRIVI